MSLNHYYERELVILRQLGKEFAEQNPALAPFLTTPGRDPDVERLLESFAFLSGRLHQKLDDELPEITHALFNLLWPNYLRTVPSCSIIKYLPTANVTQLTVIPKGTIVESEAVNETPCKFQTIYDTEVLPVDLQNLSFVTQDGKAVMKLKFVTKGIGIDKVTFEKMKFYLHGEASLVHTLYYYFIKKVRSFSIVIPDTTGKEHTVGQFGQDSIQPLGFGRDDVLYPYPANSFPGYRVLQEYFCFPEKFHFVELQGLRKAFASQAMADISDKGNTFYINFVLGELPANFESFTADNIQLFSTPVVNIFPKSSSPITFDHKQTEYRIVPDPRLPYDYSTFSVERVASWNPKAKGEVEYTPFESFDHLSAVDDSSAYYRLRMRPAVKDESIETWISFIHKNGNAPDFEHIETISLELLCTNRLLPLQLGIGDIHVESDKGGSGIPFKNITAVTPPYMPPLGGDLFWRLLSNMALNYIPLTNVKALRGILTTYDFRAIYDSRRARVLDQIMDGMVSIQSTSTDRIYRGLPIRGSRTLLTLNQRKFSCEGDMYLFASVLNEFFALYATVNSFHQLLVQEEKSGEQYQWEARLGAQVL